MTSNPASNHVEVRDIARGALWNLLGLTAKLTKVIFLYVVITYYGETTLGLYLLSWSIVDITSKFGMWGFDKNMIRDIARFHTDQSPATNQRIFSIIYFNIGVAFLLSLFVTAIVLFISPWIAMTIFNEVDLVDPLWYLTLTIPFIVFGQVCIAATKGLRIMHYEVLVRQGLEPILLLTGAAICIPFGWGVFSLIFTHLTASIIVAVAAFFTVLRKYSYLGWIPAPLEKDIKRDTFRYIYPVAVMDALNLLVARIDIILVGSLMNAASAGLYGFALEIMAVFKAIRQGLEPVFSSIVSGLFYQKQQERLQRHYILITRWLGLGNLLPVVILVMFPTYVLSLLNVHSTSIINPLIILTLAYGLICIFSGAESVLIMTGKTLLNTVIGLIILLVNIIVTYLLIPEYGMAGAAVGTLSSYGVGIIIRIYFGYRVLQLMPISLLSMWPFIPATCAAMLCHFINISFDLQSIWAKGLALMVILIVYVSIYFVKELEPEEKHLVVQFKGRIKNALGVSGH